MYTDQYLAFDSHHPLQHKHGVVRTLVHRSKTVITREEDKEVELQHLKKVLNTCGYGEWTFQVAQSSMSKQQRDQRQVQRSQNKLSGRPYVTIPYIKGISEALRRIFNKRGISVHLKPRNTLRELLVSPKDKTEPNNKCGVVYQINCNNCNASYIGETERALGTRISEHKRDSSRPIGVLEDKNVSAIAEHAIKSQHHIDWKDIKVLDHEELWFERGVLEAAHIRINRASLNKDGGRHQLPAAYGTILKSLSPVGGRD